MSSRARGPEGVVAPPPRSRTAGRPRLTKSQQAILRLIAGETALNGGLCASKRELAAAVEKSVRTVDIAISVLRGEGLIVAEPRFESSGAQCASFYRLSYPTDVVDVGPTEGPTHHLANEKDERRFEEKQ